MKESIRTASGLITDWGCKAICSLQSAVLREKIALKSFPSNNIDRVHKVLFAANLNKSFFNLVLKEEYRIFVYFFLFYLYS